jgi:hypothetical protein
MKEIVLKAIREIVANKIKNKRSPNYALSVELSGKIRKQVDSALCELMAENIITSGDSLNHNFFKLNEPVRVSTTPVGKEPVIKFSYNWNNKLDNHAFTTIRIHRPQKYKVGNNYRIDLNGETKGRAIMQDIRVLKIEQLNEFICRLDTGCNRQETLHILQRIYSSVDFKSVVFDFCLLVYESKSKTSS